MHSPQRVCILRWDLLFGEAKQSTRRLSRAWTLGARKKAENALTDSRFGTQPGCWALAAAPEKAFLIETIGQLAFATPHGAVVVMNFPRSLSLQMPGVAGLKPAWSSESGRCLGRRRPKVDTGWDQSAMMFRVQLLACPACTMACFAW
jgi:hypothetical protein